MPAPRAVLLDVFETVLTVDFDAVLNGLAEASGVAKEHWLAGLDDARHDLMTGTISPAEAVTAIFERARVRPRDVSTLVRRDPELLLEHATAYPDVAPFLAELRDRGIASAFVSNCAPNAGPLLSRLGLAAQVDAVILSCEVGATKPDAAIYTRALEALAVDASDAVFVDDQASYCVGAEAIGMKAVRIDRQGRAQRAVQSLEDVLQLL